MMAFISGRVGKVWGFSVITARRKLAASVAYGKQVEGEREHGLLSTWRKRRNLENKSETKI